MSLSPPAQRLGVPPSPEQWLRVPTTSPAMPPRPCDLQSNASVSLSPPEQRLSVPTTSRAMPLCPCHLQSNALVSHHLQSNGSVSPPPPQQYLHVLVTSRAIPPRPCHLQSNTSVFHHLHSNGSMSPALTIFSPCETRVKTLGCSSPAQVPAAAVPQRDLPTELNLAESFAKKPLRSESGRAGRVPSHPEGQY